MCKWSAPKLSIMRKFCAICTMRVKYVSPIDYGKSQYYYKKKSISDFFLNEQLLFYGYFVLLQEWLVILWSFIWCKYNIVHTSGVLRYLDFINSAIYGLIISGLEMSFFCLSWSKMLKPFFRPLKASNGLGLLFLLFSICI